MKILVIKPSSLGDVIHALPFLKALRDAFPEALIDWVISKNLKGILEDNPLINELVIFNKDAWKHVKNLPDTISEISALKKTLKSKHYDMLIDLQGLLRSGIIGFFTPATTKIGYQDAREGSRYFYDKKIRVNKNLHAVDRHLAVARAIGAKSAKAQFPLHITPAAADRAKKLLGNIGEYIVIAPSARWLTKRWQTEDYASLINKISLPCLITGSRTDRQIAQTITKISAQSEPETAKNHSKKPEKAKTIINLCGKTDLKELTALIAGAKAVVSNDSGPMHIAAALDIPTIAIFGPTDPAKTGPYGWGKNRKLKVIKADVPCSPCRRKRCNKFICMKNIGVETVYKALKEYL